MVRGRPLRSASLFASGRKPAERMEEESDRIFSLIQSLRHPNKKVIRQAAESLIAMASRAPLLARRLEQALSGAPEKSRWPLAYVLAHLPGPSPSTLQVLLETLDTRDPDIRWAIGLVLVRLGKSDPTVVKLLLGLLRSGSPNQRRMAVYCLRDLELRDGVSLQALLESLGDPEALVRVAAMTSLKSRPDLGDRALDRLLDLFLRDPDPRVRHTAALILGELGAPSDEIRAALMDASRSEDPQLKKAANAALGLLRKKRPAASGK